MNISPSDTDVRQGYSLAEGAQTLTSNAQRSTAKPVGSIASGNDEASAMDSRSASAAAAADRAAAIETAQKLEQQLQENGTGLKIRLLDDPKSSVQVEVIDQSSNKVLRKIPQDELIKLSASIKEMTGVLLNNPA